MMSKLKVRMKFRPKVDREAVVEAIAEELPQYYSSRVFAERAADAVIESLVVEVTQRQLQTAWVRGYNKPGAERETEQDRWLFPSECVDDSAIAVLRTVGGVEER